MTSVRNIKLLCMTTIFVNKLSATKTVVKKSPPALLSKPGNFVVCPLSLEVLFALLKIGARGNTSRDITKGLNIPESLESILETYTFLDPNRQDGQKLHPLETAQRICVKQNFKFNDHFENNATNIFHTEIKSYDFSKSEEISRELNNWLKEKTYGKFVDTINSDHISNNTCAVFLSTMYFKATWITEFKRNSTKKNRFYIDTTKYIDVDMMEVIAFFDFWECSELDAKFLQIQYEGSNFTMTAVLPNNIEGLTHLEENIKHVFRKPQYKKQAVHVLVPKFEITNKIDFNDILEGLGVNTPFQDTADFDLLVEDPKKHAIKVGEVFQKTNIEIGEQDTTTVNVELAKAAPVPQYVSFHCDHPFVFYLSDKTSGISFIGRFTIPPGSIKTLSTTLKKKDNSFLF